MQMTLPLFGRGYLRPALEEFLSTQCYELAEATAIDYQERGRWLFGALGEFTPLDQITYARLTEVIRKHGPSGRGLLYVTLKKRLRLLHSVIDHAHNMGWCGPAPKLPRMPNDGKPGKIVHSRLQFAAFRLALPEGRFRDLADLAWWTGHHTYDLFRLQRQHFDLAFQWDDDHVGAFWRQNHKNKNCEPTWFPLEKDARPYIEGILERTRLGREAVILGQIWNIGKTFEKAADRAEVPRVSPLRLRASMATRLLADGYPPEYVRLALGHVGAVGVDGKARAPTTLTRHYAGVSRDVSRMIPDNVR